ncbi:Sac2 family-domain-containing protein [Pelagophyceae sp. CCMP2097]|nr:Sac2 family-domain-containing protein [Pelagophyceae sp. CCMP2097]
MAELASLFGGSEDLDAELERALGSEFAAADFEALQNDVEITKALANGLSLRDYAAFVDAELDRVEQESIRDYSAQATRVALLHVEMSQCDAVLLRMGGELSGFGAELSGVTSELWRLCESTTGTKHKLRNRTEATAVLSRYLGDLVLPSDFDAVLNGHFLDPLFFEYLGLLQTRLEFSEAVGWGEAASGAECRSKLEELRGTASRRCRDLLLSAITKLKKARDTADARLDISRVGAGAVGFLAKFAPEFAIEVKVAYIEAISKTLATLFKQYDTALWKLERPAGHSLVAVDDDLKHRSMFSNLLPGPAGHAAKASRAGILAGSPMERPQIVAHMAQGDVFCIEEVFLASAKVVCDVAASERRVVGRLFSSLGSAETDCVFRSIFQKPLAALADDWDKRLAASLDVSGLLIIVRLARAAKRRARPEADAAPEATATSEANAAPEAFLDAGAASADGEARKGFEDVPEDASENASENAAAPRPRRLRPAFEADAVESYFGRLADEVAWPRILDVLAKHVDSVRAATKAASTASRAAALAASTSPNKLSRWPPPLAVPTTPHFVSRQYADLATSVLALFDASAKHAFEDRLVSALDHLREATVDLLGVFAAKSDMPVVFLINNYDVVVRAFQERNVEAGMFEKKLVQLRAEYVESALLDKCGALTEFVRKTDEAKDALAAGRPLDLDAAVVESVAREFQEQWKSTVSSLNGDVLRHFCNFRNGLEILKMCLQRLLRCYSRFLDIIKKAWRRPPPFAQYLVPTASILNEVKLYSRTFD